MLRPCLLAADLLAVIINEANNQVEEHPVIARRLLKGLSNVLCRFRERNDAVLGLNNIIRDLHE